MFALTWSNTALDALADIYVAAEPDERARMAAALEALNVRCGPTHSPLGNPEQDRIASR